jgi:hypothetical protein
MIFRGILGRAFIKYIYVYLTNILKKLETKKFWNALTIGVSIFMFLNCLISSIAVTRRSHRLKGEPPQNSIEQILDTYYPNERMSKVYPSMKIL